MIYASRNEKSDNSGFTLIELVAVILIVGLMMSAGIYYLGNLDIAKLKTSASKIAAMVRYVNNLSVINNVHYKLVIDFGDNSYHAEAVQITDSMCSPVKSLVKKGEEEEEGKEEDEFAKEGESSKNRAVKTSGDKHLKSALISKRKLEPPVKFKEVVTEFSGSVKEGKAEILFFPDGTIEKALIYIGTEDKTNTIEIMPGLGTAKIYRKRIEKNIASSY